MPPGPAPSGHYHLWVNGVHHGDITPENMMYTVLPTGELKGVLRDYDLASRDVHPTVNRDHTGTIPFMALEIVEYRFEKRIPQLYRHDSESFIWVLAYLTLANVEYNEIRFVKISRPLPTLDPWFAGGRSCSHSVETGSILRLWDQTIGRWALREIPYDHQMPGEILDCA